MDQSQRDAEQADDLELLGGKEIGQCKEQKQYQAGEIEEFRVLQYNRRLIALDVDPFLDKEREDPAAESEDQCENEIDRTIEANALSPFEETKGAKVERNVAGKDQ